MTDAEREAAKLAEGIARASSLPPAPLADTDPAPPARQPAPLPAGLPHRAGVLRLPPDQAERARAKRGPGPEPDVELRKLGELARATCGCAACARTLRQQGRPERAGASAAPQGSCLAGVMLGILEGRKAARS